MDPKQKQHPVVDVTGDGSKVWYFKEQYCIGTWNVRSMNQGKLEVVKQQMARVNIDILGIGELKWTWMGEFNSDGHYIYYWARIPSKKWSNPHSQQKSPKCSTWVQSQKWQNDLCSFLRTIQYHNSPSLCPYPKSLQTVTAVMKLRLLLLRRKVMTNLDSILKSRDITLPTKVCLV